MKILIANHLNKVSYYDDNTKKWHTEFELLQMIDNIIKLPIGTMKFIDGCPYIKFNNIELVIENIDLLENKYLLKLKKRINRELIVKKIKLFSKRNKLKLFKNNIKGKVAIIASAGILTIFGLNISNDQSDLTSNTLEPIENPIIQEEIIENLESYEDNNEVIIKNDIKIVDEPLKVEELTDEEKIIDKYSKMYFMDYDILENLMSENFDNSKSYELNVISIAQNYYWENESIDKTSIPSNLQEEEKEQKILEFANIYNIQDEDTLATLIGVHRLETGYGTSKIYLESNNCGGVFKFENGKGSLARFKTIDIGAESFVRNFVYNMSLAQRGINSGDPRYDANKSLAFNLNVTYCMDPIGPSEMTWAEIVDQIKEEVKETDILDNYISFDIKKI